MAGHRMLPPHACPPRATSPIVGMPMWACTANPPHAASPMSAVHSPRMPCPPVMSSSLKRRCRTRLRSSRCRGTTSVQSSRRRAAWILTSESRAPQNTHFVTVAITLAFPNTRTSAYSAAKPQSLQRGPLTRPGPGPTALPGYRSHTRKGCTTSATPATASAKPCHMSKLFGLLTFQWNNVFKSVA
eukprot:366313-Chlamydomonas_euryale.AAC.9